MTLLGSLGSTGFFALGASVPSVASAVEFNSAFLSKQGAPVELKYFEQGSSVAPGHYNVDIYLNQQLILRQRIEFATNGKDNEVKPLIPLSVLKAVGVNVVRLEQEKLIAAKADDKTLIDVESLAPGAGVEFDVTALALQISMPQAYIQRQFRGYVDPSLWDDGITAFYSNYQTNFSRNINQGYNSDYRYVGLRNGLNIGAWRLRNESSISGSTGVRDKFTSNRTYVERDIRSLKGKLAAGELYSQGEIFDSVRFKGAQLSSELGMLTDDEVGFAPVVRGIAETNATVEISQNNYVIYSATVPAGAFEISDIYPSGSNGDLSIKIIEADGRERQYSQAYSYLPVMTRRGNTRYSLAAGEYSNEGQAAPKFTQGTLVYGVTDNFTGYGGLIAAQAYKALNLGVGVNSPWGGLSFDVTNSSSQERSGRKNVGQSARFLYSKTLSQTDTTFTMVGYRYSTESYRTFSQHVEEQEHVATPYYGRQKSRFDVNVNQSLDGRGSLFLSLGETSYWNRQGSTRRWQFGYNGNYSDISYSFAVSRTEGQAGSQGADNQMTASFSIPFGDTRRSQRLYTSVTTSNQGESAIQTGLSGNLNDENTLNYSAQGSHSKISGSSASFGVNWDTPTAKVSGNYGQGRDNKHLDVGASGSVVVHSGGVTLGQPVGETFALVEIPDTKGIGIDSSNAVRTDSKGYAVVPYAQPYRYNWINLDTSTMGSSIEVAESSKKVVPTRGAVVKTHFEVESGRRLQFNLTDGKGAHLPFGAQAYDDEGKVLGLVDNASKLLVFGLKDVGTFKVKWGSLACEVKYDLPPVNKELMYEQYSGVCL
ncbi:fimbria/pilus outer membrane usher protein [Pseudomonas sp. OST1909]|uniref:fimbria/pilus outer membrane usher protein n=1 Tax=Pseudomonas sp. OST1909 TaxID=2777367 RepID=UPI0018876550|nr:fimbria/pilus outer membrane usher protein [Pseudomonas sp. OST1909]QOY73641.1 fimbrial biogenesis outer membrane usher protein [Pseudomonas sp. OST1909]